STPGRRPAVLRGPVRGRHRRGARHLRRHREVLPVAGPEAARGAARRPGRGPDTGRWSLMERHDLEDRLRASLQARADDVQPTPELWERVSERTTRRARWQLGAWVLSGAAAVAVLVLGGIVLLNQQDGVRIDPRPDIADTPTVTDTAPGTETPVPTSDTPTVV